MSAFKTNNTSYLRTDLQYNQLVKENVADLVIFPDFANEATTVSRVRTTGNGIIYINGAIELVSAPLAQGDLIASFPKDFAPIGIQIKNFTVVGGFGATFTPFVLYVTEDGEIRAHEPFGQGGFIYLDGIHYFREVMP